MLKNDKLSRPQETCTVSNQPTETAEPLNEPMIFFDTPETAEPNDGPMIFFDLPETAEPLNGPMEYFDPPQEDEHNSSTPHDRSDTHTTCDDIPIAPSVEYSVSAKANRYRIGWDELANILNSDRCSPSESMVPNSQSKESSDLKSEIPVLPSQRQNAEPINRDQRDTQSASAPINALLSPLRLPSTGIVTETPAADNDFVYSNPSQVGYPQQMSPFTQGSTHVQPNQGMTVYPRRQKETKPSVTPYKAYQKLVSQYYFKVFEGSLYIFQNGVYHHLDSEMAKTLIMELCAEELSVTGQPRFISDTLDFLLTSARNKIVEEAINKNLICFANGLIDIQTNMTYPATPEIFTTHRLLCAFTPQHMGCPTFDQFLLHASGGDPVLIERIWEYIGYNLTPGNPAKKIFVLQGKANSGKSLLTNFLASLFPHHCVTSLGIHSLERTFALESLIGKNLCISGDLPASPLRSRTISLLKQATGGDMLHAEIKYMPAVDFKCRANFSLITNHPLRFSQDEDAFADRLIVIPFRFSVPPEQRDPFLMDKILAERNAIVYRGLQTYLRLTQQKFTFSGQFALNECGCFSAGSGSIGSQLEGEVEQFLADHFAACEGCFVPMTIIFELFTLEGHHATRLEFADLAYALAINMFGAERAKRRFEGYPNAVHGLLNVSLKPHTYEILKSNNIIN